MSSSSKILCCVGLRKSQSISRVRWPAWAMAMARLLAEVDLPSPGAGLVSRNVLASAPLAPKNSAVRTVRYASADSDIGSRLTVWPRATMLCLADMCGTTPSTGNPSEAVMSSADRSRWSIQSRARPSPVPSASPIISAAIRTRDLRGLLGWSSARATSRTWVLTDSDSMSLTLISLMRVSSRSHIFCVRFTFASSWTYSCSLALSSTASACCDSNAWAYCFSRSLAALRASSASAIRPSTSRRSRSATCRSSNRMVPRMVATRGLLSNAL